MMGIFIAFLPSGSLHACGKKWEGYPRIGTSILGLQSGGKNQSPAWGTGGTSEIPTWKIQRRRSRGMRETEIRGIGGRRYQDLPPGRKMTPRT